MLKYEAVEIGNMVTSVNQAFVNWGKSNGYNPTMCKQTLKTYITINGDKLVIDNYIVCKDGMILADLKVVS